MIGMAIGTKFWRALGAALSLAACGPLAAQTTGDPGGGGAYGEGSAPATGELRLRFSAFQLPSADARFALREIGKEGEVVRQTDPFAIPTRNLGIPVTVGSRKLVLGVVRPGEGGGNGKAPFRRVAALELPRPGRAFVVLLVPGGDNPGRLAPRIVPAEADAFAPGAIRMFNLGPARLAWRLGEQTGVIESYGEERVTAPEQPDKGAFSVEFYFEREGGAERFAVTQWVRRPNVRSFVFFYPATESGRYRYRVFEDHPAWTRSGDRSNGGAGQ